MTLAAELRAALPRGVVVHVHGRAVFVTAKHPDGLHTVAAEVGPVDEVIVFVARELRRHVEQWGPIVTAPVGSA